MKKCKIIINPQSGKKKKVNYQNIHDILSSFSYDSEIIFTKKKNDATQIMKNLDDDIDLVISAGGDGTLNEVVEGNNNRKNKLVIANLPLGTTNDVGNMYGLNKSISDNLKLILSGTSKKIDICTINKKSFVYVACLGDYIDMAYNTPRKLKKLFGKLGYALYALTRIKNKINTYKVKYKVNNKTYEDEFSFFFITNSIRVAGVNDIYYDVKLDDNMFEVAMAKVKTKKEMIRMLTLVLNLDIKDIPGITYYQTNNFEIEFLNDIKTSWCVDGEEYKEKNNKFTFSVNQNMKMKIPNEKIDKLFINEDKKYEK